MTEEFKPPRAELEQRVDVIRRIYRSPLGVIAPETWHMHTSFFFRHGLLECLGMMLLGMALLRLGVLTGAASTRTYLMLSLVGYAIGLSVNLFETVRLENAGFNVQALIASYLTYDLGRIPMTLGHIGTIGLVCRSGTAIRLTRVLASAGQMALTNYLMQSAICMLLFTGAGLAWFGQLQRYELYYVVAAIWMLQLVASPLWLRRFRFGP